MAKTGFHTYDIFNNEDVVTRWKYFNFCHKKALGGGLVCGCPLGGSVAGLGLWGSACLFLCCFFFAALAAVSVSVGGRWALVFVLV